MRRIDPPRRVFGHDLSRSHGRKRSFDLENEKAPSDWKEKAAQSQLGAFKVTIENTDKDDEVFTKREISTSITKPLIKDPIKVISTGPIKKLQKVKTLITEDSDSEDMKQIQEKEQVELENLREANKASDSIIKCAEFLFSNEDLEDLEDFKLPKDATQIAKLARFGRDREGKNILSVLLEWKNIKAFVTDFSKEAFAPIMHCLTLLIAGGADPMVADKFGKCCSHYLAEWRYTKEKVDDHKNLQLPRRVKEILEELGYVELQCYKPNPCRAQQPSLLYPRDEEKNTFLHSLVKHNYKRKPQYKQENHCLFRAMQVLLVNLKIPNALWSMTSRDKMELRALFQQPGLFMEQNFNRIRATTQSAEIDEFFKKIPKNAVIKFMAKAKPLSDQVEVSRKSREKTEKPAKEKSSSHKSSRERRKNRSPNFEGEKYERKVEVVARSPTPKRKSRSSSPKMTSRKIKRKSPERKKKNKRTKSSSYEKNDKRCSSSPGEREDQERDRASFSGKNEEEYLTDNEDDMLDVGVSADDFIEDAIAMIPARSKSSKRKAVNKMKRSERKPLSPKRKSNLSYTDSPERKSKKKSFDSQTHDHKQRSQSLDRKFRTPSCESDDRSRSREEKTRVEKWVKKRRSKSREPKLRSRSSEKKIRSRSRGKNRPSDSRDNKIRSRSREPKFRSRSREPKFRSRSRESNFRSPSREADNCSQSREVKIRGGSPKHQSRDTKIRDDRSARRVREMSPSRKRYNSSEHNDVPTPVPKPDRKTNKSPINRRKRSTDSSEPSLKRSPIPSKRDVQRSRKVRNRLPEKKPEKEEISRNGRDSRKTMDDKDYRDKGRVNDRLRSPSRSPSPERRPRERRRVDEKRNSRKSAERRPIRSSSRNKSPEQSRSNDKRRVRNASGGRRRNRSRSNKPVSNASSKLMRLANY